MYERKRLIDPHLSEDAASGRGVETVSAATQSLRKRPQEASTARNARYNIVSTIILVSGSGERAGRVAFEKDLKGGLPVASSTLARQAVHRSLVHKQDGDQVVLREVRSDDGQHLEFDVRGSRAQLHSMLDDTGFVAEALRQSTIALAHLHYGVPNGWAFLMDRMRFRIDAASLVDHPPTTIRITARDVRSRGTHVHSLTSELEMISGEKTLATGEGYLRVVNPPVYQRLRAGRPLRPSSSAASRSKRPITLRRLVGGAGTLPTHWVASIDPDDPFFFDHEVDHVPGMAIFEAACTLATLTSRSPSPRIDFFDGRFHEFVELEAPLSLSIEQSPTRTDDRYCVRVDASTHGRLAMSASIGVSAPWTPSTDGGLTDQIRR